MILYENKSSNSYVLGQVQDIFDIRNAEIFVASISMLR